MSKTLDIINNDYFDWMCELVCDGKRYKQSNYQRLLRYLHDKEFVYIIEMDGNRAEDGVDLRYRVAYEHRLDWTVVRTYLDDKPCSVLEMMVALSVRCEEHIMDNPAIGNRTGQWFWGMVANLGIKSATDDKFNETVVNRKIEQFLNREYDPNGRGGLFVVRDCKYDLRTVEIWCQMNWYLSEAFDE